jgi:hypothetical protein
MNVTKPNVGDLITVRGTTCKVTKVYKFGTADVVSLDGKRAWRVTGLGWL